MTLTYDIFMCMVHIFRMCMVHLFRMCMVALFVAGSTDPATQGRWIIRRAEIIPTPCAGFLIANLTFRGFRTQVLKNQVFRSFLGVGRCLNS